MLSAVGHMKYFYVQTKKNLFRGRGLLTPNISIVGLSLFKFDWWYNRKLATLFSRMAYLLRGEVTQVTLACSRQRWYLEDGWTEYSN